MPLHVVPHTHITRSEALVLRHRREGTCWNTFVGSVALPAAASHRHNSAIHHVSLIVCLPVRLLVSRRHPLMNGNQCSLEMMLINIPSCCWQGTPNLQSFHNFTRLTTNALLHIPILHSPSGAFVNRYVHLWDTSAPAAVG